MLLIVILFLAATCCAGANAEKADDYSGEILLSNLRTPDSSLSDEEIKMMDQIRKIGENATVIQGASGQDSIYAVNTTDEILKSVELYVTFYDQDTALVKEMECDIDDWKPGEVINGPMQSQGIGYSANYLTAKLQIQYKYNGVFYRTNQEPIHVKAERKSGKAQMTPKGGVPQTIALQDWSGKAEYELTRFIFGPDPNSSDGYYQFTAYFKKLSGEIKDNPTIYYRIVRDDGTVYDTGSFYDIKFMETGETMKYVMDYIRLPEGVYSLSFEE